MIFLSYEEIKPRGWLKKQLELQATGLSGHLDEMWPDIKESRWIGGEREGWERLPYWLDGFIPLAYILEDKDKKRRIKKYIDLILQGQQEDGWLCPCGIGEREHYDLWALFLMLKSLVVYAECSGDERIEDCIYRSLKNLSQLLKRQTLSNWAAARWFECLIPILWLKERRPEAWLIELAVRLKAQGIDYTCALGLWKGVKGEWSYETHVVNAAMALRGEALWCALTGEALTDEAERLYRLLTEYHSTAYGHFTGDECLAGNSPIQGSELCGVVEAMYSYELLFFLTGKSEWGERLELIAFNALPATLETNMWSHQYDQMTNQPAAIHFPDPPIFGTNGPESNMFGLEPNFGCCTANFSQAWPKFARAVIGREKDGFTILSCVPFLAESSYGNGLIKLECISEYPFRPKIRLKVDHDGDERWTLRVRIPADTEIKDCEGTREGMFLLFTPPAGHWETEWEFLARPRLIKRPRELYALRYGALLFALPIEGRKEKREYISDGVERKFPYCDYEIFPDSAWEYAFVRECDFEVIECAYEAAFDRERPPLKIKTKLAPIDWGWEEGHRWVAAVCPKGERSGKDEEKFLQPYGSTTLRMTELPMIEKGEK